MTPLFWARQALHAPLVALARRNGIKPGISDMQRVKSRGFLMSSKSGLKVSISVSVRCAERIRGFWIIGKCVLKSRFSGMTAPNKSLLISQNRSRSFGRRKNSF